MSWFKKEMKEFWFSCRHPFGIDDVLTPPDLSPTDTEITAIKNLLELSKERLELSTTSKQAKPKVMNVMAPSILQLGQSSVSVIESYIRRVDKDEEENIS